MKILITGDAGETKEIITDGCAILTLDAAGNLNIEGKVNTKAMAPLIAKAVMSKFGK